MKEPVQLVIARIYKSSSQSRRYEVELTDGKIFSIHEDVLVTYGLHKGMAVGEDEWQRWIEADERAKVRLAAYHYLSYRSRTAAEVKRHLRKGEWDEQAIILVIDELCAARYIDDRSYACEWVKQRHKNKGMGERRLRQELQQKGIADHWIEEALSIIDEDQERQQAMKIAERRYLRICDESWDKIERRIGALLIRKGYSATIVYAVLNRLREHDRKGG